MRARAPTRRSGFDPKHRMVRRYPAQPRPGGVRPDSAEEGPHFPLPPPQVLAQQRRLLLVWELRDGDRLALASEQQPALSADTNVLDPLCVPARRDQRANAVN